jgi:2,3-bisphosphoglycerate-independent phosphoglycerate mutase
MPSCLGRHLQRQALLEVAASVTTPEERTTLVKVAEELEETSTRHLQEAQYLSEMLQESEEVLESAVVQELQREYAQRVAEGEFWEERRSRALVKLISYCTKTGKMPPNSFLS